MKKRVIIYFLVIGFFIVVGNRDFFDNWDKYPKEQFIPPVFYTDGSVEYTLKTKLIFVKQNRKRIYPEPWSIRIPDLTDCLTPSENGICLEHEPKGLMPTYFIPENNLILRIILTFPDFEILDDEEKNKDLLLNRRKQPGIARLILGADYMEYNLSSPDKGGKLTFVEHYNKGTGSVCEIESEAFTSVFRMRDLTAEEKQKRKVRPDSNCVSKITEGLVKYVYFKAPDQPVAYGLCYTARVADRCNFMVWLRQNRHADFEFERSHLSNFRELYEAVNSYVDRLVALSSKNASKTEVKY